MMSRRNVISVCIVIAVIMVLVIILASTGNKKEKNNDGNSGSGGMYAQDKVNTKITNRKYQMNLIKKPDRRLLLIMSQKR